MRPFGALKSSVVPLLYADIDTDQIIPASHLTSRTPEEFANGLFNRLRSSDPEFVLNDPAMRGRSILLAGTNFGCGSSREAAVWALKAGGFEAVIAPSFGEIFETNSLKNGLLPIRLESASYDELVRTIIHDRDATAIVDLAAGTLQVPGAVTASFEIDAFYRTLFLEGMDELGYLLSHEAAIEAYEAENMNPLARWRIEA